MHETVTAATTMPLPEHTDIAIVGAGFGGLGMAIRLEQQGVADFVVLERAADVGGTWFANTYPGCQCDVPSNLYSFSFAPKPDWTHSYPEQPQIQRYLRGCAERFGVLDRIHLGCEMHEAAWDADTGRWRIDTEKGTLRARTLVVAPGLLSEPKAPPIPGLDTFRGTIFHTADWDHGHDLAGERVALIGTGATAIQVGPRIRPMLERLHVFQRTPPWIIPHPDRAIPRSLQRLYAHVPILQRLARQGVYALREALAAGMTHHRSLLRAFELIARVQLRMQVPDRAMRAQLTPGYHIGCKRVLLSNDWYPMLAAPNCELVTAPIAEVRERAIVTADGVQRPVDSIIFATGFRPTDPPIAYRLRGAHGQLLSDVWNGSPQAYLGTVVSGFPNLFMLYGPNLNLGHSSIVYMLESQIHYVLQALSLLRDDGVAALDVRAAVQRAYNEDIARRLSTTVWDIGGCASWYLDANGRNSTMWPDYTFRYRQIVERLDPADYEIQRSPRPLATA
jgi:cation diffusion facilitator CzcD-associated flavoprotein CzcO